MARTLLVESKLLRSFWAEAVNTSCYILNRVMVRPVLRKTPYELLKGLMIKMEKSFKKKSSQRKFQMELKFLPNKVKVQDWGFFVPYLTGSISLVVLAVGSISPGLLQAAIGGFSSFFPDYQERIAAHEAAHFLVAYLIGLPILGYSLDIGKEHVNLLDERLQQLIYSGKLDGKELDRLAVVSMAGLAAEGLRYDKVVGQSADLFTLQRFINRSKPQLSKEQQQNLTRWAVLFAGSLLKNNKIAYESLMSAMSRKASVLECIEAIESAAK